MAPLSRDRIIRACHSCPAARWRSSTLVLGTACAQPMPPEIASALARARVPLDAVSLLVLPLDGGAAPA